MIDPKIALLRPIIAEVLEELAADETSEAAWEKAHAALDATTGEEEEDLYLAIECRELEALREIYQEWMSGKRPLPAQDRAVLKRAMKAYRKRIKLLLLDEESKVGVGPMSSGRESDIVGITPPEQYPLYIWDELVRLGELRSPAYGMYELGSG